MYRLVQGGEALWPYCPQTFLLDQLREARTVHTSADGAEGLVQETDAAKEEETAHVSSVWAFGGDLYVSFGQTDGAEILVGFANTFPSPGSPLRKPGLLTEKVKSQMSYLAGVSNGADGDFDPSKVPFDLLVAHNCKIVHVSKANLEVTLPEGGTAPAKLPVVITIDQAGVLQITAEPSAEFRNLKLPNCWEFDLMKYSLLAFTSGEGHPIAEAEFLASIGILIVVMSVGEGCRIFAIPFRLQYAEIAGTQDDAPKQQQLARDARPPVQIRAVSATIDFVAGAATELQPGEILHPITRNKMLYASSDLLWIASREALYLVRADGKGKLGQRPAVEGAVAQLASCQNPLIARESWVHLGEHGIATEDIFALCCHPQGGELLITQVNGNLLACVPDSSVKDHGWATQAILTTKVSSLYLLGDLLKKAGAFPFSVVAHNHSLAIQLDSAPESAFCGLLLVYDLATGLLTQQISMPQTGQWHLWHRITSEEDAACISGIYHARGILLFANPSVREYSEHLAKLLRIRLRAEERFKTHHGMLEATAAAFATRLHTAYGVQQNALSYHQVQWVYDWAFSIHQAGFIPGESQNIELDSQSHRDGPLVGAITAAETVWGRLRQTFPLVGILFQLCGQGGVNAPLRTNLSVDQIPPLIETVQRLLSLVGKRMERTATSRSLRVASESDSKLLEVPPKAPRAGVEQPSPFLNDEALAAAIDLAVGRAQYVSTASAAAAPPSALRQSDPAAPPEASSMAGSEGGAMLSVTIAPVLALKQQLANLLLRLKDVQTALCLLKGESPHLTRTLPPVHSIASMSSGVSTFAPLVTLTRVSASNTCKIPPSADSPRPLEAPPVTISEEDREHIATALHQEWPVLFGDKAARVFFDPLLIRFDLALRSNIALNRPKSLLALVREIDSAVSPSNRGVLPPSVTALQHLVRDLYGMSQPTWKGVGSEEEKSNIALDSAFQALPISLAPSYAHEVYGCLLIEGGLKSMAVAVAVHAGQWQEAFGILAEAEKEDNLQTSTHGFLDPHLRVSAPAEPTLSPIQCIGDLALLGLLHTNTVLQQSFSSPSKAQSELSTMSTMFSSTEGDSFNESRMTATSLSSAVRWAQTTFTRISCFHVMLVRALRAANIPVIQALWSHFPAAYSLPSLLATLRFVLQSTDGVPANPAASIPAWVVLPVIGIVAERHRRDLQILVKSWRRGTRLDDGTVLRVWGEKQGNN